MSDLIDKQVEHWIRNLATLQDELEHSTSDRSCVIVAAAYIDELLEYLLKNFLYSPSSEKEDKDFEFFFYSRRSKKNEINSICELTNDKLVCCSSYGLTIYSKVDEIY